MARHQWTKEDIRFVYKTCSENPNKEDRLRILLQQFPNCSRGSLGFQIIRYQKRNDNKMRWNPEQNIFEGFGANGRLHDEVWNERNWKQL
jgi:hypothetical protein